MSAQKNVTNDTGTGQFEVRRAEGTAVLRYVRGGDALDLVHTEVPAVLQGRGVGGELVRAALEYARAEGLMVVPTCPFVKGWIRRHPEFAVLVAR